MSGEVRSRPHAVGLALKVAVLGAIVAVTMPACASAAAPPASTPTAPASPSPDPTQHEYDTSAAGQGLTRPGSLPAGVYTTTYFPSQLTLTVGDGWSSTEDSTGEFQLGRPGLAGEPSLLFWQDVVPVAFDASPVADPGPTATDLLEWLRSNESLSVADIPPITIDGVSAPGVSIAVADGAANGEPGCPAKVCINVLDFPLWDVPWTVTPFEDVVLWTFDRPDENRIVIVARASEGFLEPFKADATPVLESIRFSG